MISDRTGSVFIQKILDRVEVMHPHVAQSPAVVIPIAAERLVDAVDGKGLNGGAEPKS